MGKTHVNTRLFIMSSKKNHHFWLAIFYGVITIGAVSASFSEELAHILTLIDALIRKHAAVALQLSFLAIFSLFLSALRTPAFFWRKSVYLLDFAVFRGEPFMELTKEKQKVVLEKTSCDEESRAFLERLYESSAFGETTLFPPSPMRDFPNNLNSCSMADAMVEAEMVIFKCVEDVLAKTGLSPRDIGYLFIFWLF